MRVLRGSRNQNSRQVRRSHRTIVSARPLPRRNPTPTPHVGLRCANPTYQRPIRTAVGYAMRTESSTVGRVRRVLRTIVNARPVPRRNPTPTPPVGLRCANPTYQRPIRAAVGYAMRTESSTVGRVRRALKTIVSARPVPRRNPTHTPPVGLRCANPTYRA